ncbi:hypothetical protein [Anabaena sp. UHCC 0399]|nr:hypothetical protein [Anabaena sp. UHCC 0399]MEA5567005.1 hypothetical protein [Anabaena sp. UHCC 0399]
MLFFYLQAREKAKAAIAFFHTEALVVGTGFNRFQSDPLACFTLE